MELFEFAIQQELEGERLYRHLAERAPCPELRESLLLLASEEVKHRELIEKLREGMPFVSAPVHATIAHPEGMLQAISHSLEHTACDSNQAAFFRNALDLEVSSEDFYQKLAQESSDSHQKALFFRLAGEERMHQALLEGILQLLDISLTLSSQKT